MATKPTRSPDMTYPSSASSTKGRFRRSSPGIVVFSHKRHQGQMNRRGLELTGHLDQTGTEPIMMTLSRVVGELRVQIQDNLDNRRKADLWGIIELRRVMVDAGRQILLRGFGLPNRNSQNDSRIIIVLEEDSSQQAPPYVYPCESLLPIAEEELF